MTVAELIELLKDVPPSTPVWFDDASYDGVPVTHVVDIEAGQRVGYEKLDERIILLEFRGYT